jgi:RNA polymerase sigma-70 factor (ECF subfamily)
MVSPYYQSLDDAEVGAGIAEVLAELSAINRKVVVMHYLEGCSCREIGESLGIPPGTVKRILHESRRSLRASSTGNSRAAGGRNMIWRGRYAPG